MTIVLCTLVLLSSTGQTQVKQVHGVLLSHTDDSMTVDFSYYYKRNTDYETNSHVQRLNDNDCQIVKQVKK